MAAAARGLVPLPVLCGALPAELETWADKAGARAAADADGGKKRAKKRKRQACAEFAQSPEGRRLVKYLFIKLHNTGGASMKIGNDNAASSDDESDLEAEDEGATLFVANVGIAWSEDLVRSVFEAFGEVDGVDLGSSGISRFARVRFATKTAAARALERAAASAQEGPLDASAAWPVATKKSGTAAKKPRWMQQYDAERPGLASLKRDSEAYMERFAELEKEIEELRKAQESQTDEDGFTMVSYKKGGRARTAAPATADAAQAGRAGRKITDGTGKKKSSKGPLTDFYRFQTRDHKKSKLAELRAKFEQDKQQVERLKASRRFKPLS